MSVSCFDPQNKESHMTHSLYMNNAVLCNENELSQSHILLYVSYSADSESILLLFKDKSMPQGPLGCQNNYLLLKTNSASLFIIIREDIFLKLSSDVMKMHDMLF